MATAIKLLVADAAMDLTAANAANDKIAAMVAALGETKNYGERDAGILASAA